MSISRDVSGKVFVNDSLFFNYIRRLDWTSNNKLMVIGEYREFGTNKLVTQITVNFNNRGITHYTIDHFNCNLKVEIQFRLNMLMGVIAVIKDGKVNKKHFLNYKVIHPPFLNEYPKNLIKKLKEDSVFKFFIPETLDFIKLNIEIEESERNLFLKLKPVDVIKRHIILKYDKNSQRLLECQGYLYPLNNNCKPFLTEITNLVLSYVD